MKIRTASAAVAVSAALLAGSLTGCSWESNETETYEAIECDRGDQKERDDDCGYVDDGTWMWFYWVVLGQTSYSPPGWTPPAGVKIGGGKVKRADPKAKVNKPANKQPGNPPKVNTGGNKVAPPAGGGRVGGGSGGRR